MIKIVYFSDARIPSEMAHSVAIINLCNAFNQLGVDINLVKPWRFRNRNINSNDIYKIYGIKNKFNIYDDMGVLNNENNQIKLEDIKISAYSNDKLFFEIKNDKIIFDYF